MTGGAAPAELSVVLPLYRTRASLSELIDRLLVTAAGLQLALELVCVDDCCPERSYEVALAHPDDPCA